MDAKATERVVVEGRIHKVEIEADQETGGYFAEVVGLPGCITQGDTMEELLLMAKDAIQCWLEAREDLHRRGIRVPAEIPKKQCQ